MKDARNAPQLVLRLPPELKQWLEEQAQANHRSLNGEALVALEQYRKQQSKDPDERQGTHVPAGR